MKHQTTDIKMFRSHITTPTAIYLVTPILVVMSWSQLFALHCADATGGCVPPRTDKDGTCCYAQRGTPSYNIICVEGHIFTDADIFCGLRKEALNDVPCQTPNGYCGIPSNAPCK